RIPDGAEANRPDARLAGCPDAIEVLKRAGWTRWQDFPSDKLHKQIDKSHLRVEVWSKPNPPSVAVAFGGTVFKSGKDWLSNFRWFIPWNDDEYTQIVSKVAPAFADEFRRRADSSEAASLKGAKIYSTGHSLGGGLAQQFAYALPVDPPG